MLESTFVFTQSLKERLRKPNVWCVNTQRCKMALFSSRCKRPTCLRLLKGKLVNRLWLSETRQLRLGNIWTPLNVDSQFCQRFCQLVLDTLLLWTSPMQWGVLNGFYASLLFQCFRPHCWYPTGGNMYSLELSPAVLYFCSLYPHLDSSPAVSPLTLSLLVNGSIWKIFSLLCLLLWSL